MRIPGLRRGAGPVDRGREVLGAVRALEAQLRAHTDADLRTLCASHRSRIAADPSRTTLLPEVYAAVCEAARRVFGVPPDDAQIIAGTALTSPVVVEVADGADADLLPVFPAVWHAYAGAGGVHVMTVDDDTAHRAVDRLTPLFQLLDLDVAAIEGDMLQAQRRDAYAAGVTYGRAAEFAWDFLRDNLVFDPDDCVQNHRRFAVVSAAETILIEDSKALGLRVSDRRADDSSGSPPVLADIPFRGYLTTYDGFAAMTASVPDGLAEVYRRVHQLEVVLTRTDTDRSRWVLHPGAIAQKGEFDDVLGQQCRRWYAQRHEILHAGDSGTWQLRMFDEVIEDCVAGHSLRGDAERRALREALAGLYPISPEAAESVSSGRRRDVVNLLRADLLAAYRRRAEEYDAGVFSTVTREVTLATMDQLWRECLADLHRLQDETWLARPGSLDSLAEYRQRAQELFRSTEAAARAEAVRLVFDVEVSVDYHSDDAPAAPD